MGGPGSGKKPRQYPPEIVSLICGMYQSGMTVAEIRAVAPSGYRVQTVLERHLESRRPLGKRNQSGSANASWKGEGATYHAIHLRMGKASSHDCADCQDRATDWSFTGCQNAIENAKGQRYCTHPDHYQPRCKTCHYYYDYKGRRPNGQFVSREEVMPYV